MHRRSRRSGRPGLHSGSCPSVAAVKPRGQAASVRPIAVRSPKAPSSRTIPKALGLSSEVGHILRSVLSTADEVFLTGTGAEVVPVASIDDRELGGPGPVTKQLQEMYGNAVRGQLSQYKEWNEYVS